MKDDAPLLTSPVIGFRSWRILPDGRLGAIAVKEAWQPGINTAVCSPITAAFKPTASSHTSPSGDCVCGLYAYHDLSALPERLGIGIDEVIGAVLSWGKMEVHRQGYRSQYSKVLALSYPDGAPAFTQSVLKTVAATYGIPLLPYARLGSFAEEYGASVPASLYPPPEPSHPPYPPYPGAYPYPLSYNPPPDSSGFAPGILSGVVLGVALTRYMRKYLGR